MARPGNKKKECQKYKAENGREKNKALKAERHQKRMEKMKKRTEKLKALSPEELRERKIQNKPDDYVELKSVFFDYNKARSIFAKLESEVEAEKMKRKAEGQTLINNDYDDYE